MEPIEAAARALREAHFGGEIHLPWEKIMETGRQMWLRQATDTIRAAVGEVTDEQFEKCDDVGLVAANHTPALYDEIAHWKAFRAQLLATLIGADDA